MQICYESCILLGSSYPFDFSDTFNLKYNFENIEFPW